LAQYTGCGPELFDLLRDPEEMRNLADDPESLPVRAALEDWLREVLDPEATGRRAKADQARQIAAHGGREAILATERLHGTPAPDNYRSDQ
jgi:choline-sulfatase